MAGQRPCMNSRNSVSSASLTGLTPSAMQTTSARSMVASGKARAVLAHSAGTELNADPRPDRLGGLRHGVLPGALAAAAHDQQVAVPDLEPQRPLPSLARPQQQRPRRAQRQDGHHGVLA